MVYLPKETEVVPVPEVVVFILLEANDCCVVHDVVGESISTANRVVQDLVDVERHVAHAVHDPFGIGPFLSGPLEYVRMSDRCQELMKVCSVRHQHWLVKDSGIVLGCMVVPQLTRLVTAQDKAIAEVDLEPDRLWIEDVDLQLFFPCFGVQRRDSVEDI